MVGSILDLRPVDPPADLPIEKQQVEEAPEATSEPEEFEIVVGRRQIASILFLGTVIAAVLCSMSYLAGKALALKKTVAVEQSPPAPPLITLNQEPAKPEPKPEPPLFADPVKGAVYIQMGAVERGVAVIFAEGLRKHGFDSFVAPG